MRFIIEFRKEAVEDILETINWYEKQVPGLGDEFFISFTNEVRNIRRSPLLYAAKYKQIRKAITKRFPYIIYFLVKSPNKVIVLAVLHMKRGSFNWEKRMK